MSAAVQLATAYVSLVVEAKDVASGVAKQLAGIEKAASATGEKSGNIFARAFGSKAKLDTKQLESALDAAKQKAEQASRTVVAARQRQEDADRKAAIAEKAYAEAVERSGEGSSKALAAQDRMILAKRKAEAASHGLQAAEQAEEHAAKEVAAAQQRVGTAAQQSGQQVSGFGHKVRNALQQGIGHINPFSGLSRKAAAEGAESGNAFSAKFKGGISGIGAGIGRLIGPAIAAVGVAEVGRGMADVVNRAGQLEQSIGAIDSVFKESAGQMHAWSDQAATAVGLSKNEFNELGTLIGAQLKNGGTAISELAPKTNELIGLGADLSSMFGGTTREAVEALSSALKGERDPIERYGVSLKQAEIDAKAASLGFEKVGGSFSNEAQQAATLALIMEQTKDAHGNFAKESDTYAHKVQVLSQQWENFTTGLGQAFLPVAMSALDWLANLGPAIQPVAEEFGRLGTLLFSGDYTGPIFGLEEDNPIIGILAGIRDAVESTIQVGQLLFTGDYSGTPFGLEEDSPAINALFQFREGFMQLGGVFAQLMEPGGAVMNLIDSIGAGFNTAWAAVGEHLLPILGELWTSFTGAVAGVLPQLEGGFAALGSAATTLGAIIAVAFAAIGTAWDAVGPYVLPLVEGFVTYIGGAFQTLSQVLSGIMTTILGVITGNWGQAWDGVRAIWDGVWGYLQAAWQWLVTLTTNTFAIIGTTIGGAWNSIKDLTGAALGAIRDGMNSAWQWLVGVTTSAWENLKTAVTRPFIDAWNSVSSTLGTFKQGISDGFNWILTTTGSIAKSIWDGITSAFNTGVQAAGEAFNKIKGLVTAPIKFVLQTVLNDGIIGGINRLAEKIGLKNLLPKVPIPAGFARGGILPGTSSYRDGDDQLIMARRGEGIIVSEALKDPYERKRLLALNEAALQGTSLAQWRGHYDGLHGYAGGGIIGFRGHRFTSLFAARIQAAEKMAGAQMHITQGGWRPRTSYSGTSHAGDALDITGGYRTFILPLRRVGIPTWDRAGKGNWVAHAHGVPLPGAGTAGGSAVWQAQDYLRGGDGLGGRDNGPRVGVVSGLPANASPEAIEKSKGWGEKVWDFLAGAAQAAWDFVTAPLRWFNDAISGGMKAISNIGGGVLTKLGEGIAKWPIQALKDWVADSIGIPHFAQGGYTPGGIALVGENGPELVSLPPRSYVHPTQQLAQLAAAPASRGPASYRVELHVPDGALRDLEELTAFLRMLPLAVRRMEGAI
nr:MAG TPA: tail tape measure [Caudoviricetes sp.]